jgi:protein ImuA
MNNAVPMPADPSLTLRHLRGSMAEIETAKFGLGVDRRRLALGMRDIDAVLRGGLAAGSLHEVVPAAAGDFGAAAGFACAMAARAAGNGRDTLWIRTDSAASESGDVHGPGCNLFGLPLRQLLILKVARPIDALWAMEEALKCRALAGVIAELPNDGATANLIVTRRLTLAAQKGDGFGFLFRHRPSPLSSSAETCWEIASAPSKPDRFGGLGRTALVLSLIKNRHGPIGRWSVAWDHHERVFSPLSLGMAEAAVDRPDRTRLVQAG